MRSFLKSCVLSYKYFVSPLLVCLWGAQCRYEISCSQYAENLLKDRAIPLRVSSKKILLRFLSCHPYSKSINLKKGGL
ncbi:MAG: membrane protein insertion efficiency factor YidD [Deltaproteobacteria bacterium]|nr:MAG: membrane protein insertion efficiency factor YidD [Deltaproteobacteria bacterium]